jgi:hypothetical protein
MNWQDNKAWSDQYVEQIISILKANSAHILQIEVASEDKDTHQATDMTIKIVGGDVAVRVRRNTKFRDLTIRSSLSSGSKTELQKIQEGFADWYLYAWTVNGQISEWILVNMDQLRRSGLIYRNRQQTQNHDGKSSFVSIPIAELRLNNCIVAHVKV